MTQTDKMEEIFDIVKSLSSTLDLDSLLKRIGEASEKLTDSEASSIMLVDDDKENLYFKTATGEKVAGLKKVKIKIGQGIAGNVALTKKSEIINDVSQDSRFTGQIDQQSGFKTRSILAVPILAGDEQEIIGVAEVLNKKNGNGFSDEDRRLLESLAGLAGVTILNAKFNENQRNFFINITELLVAAIESLRPKYIGRYWKMTQLATLVARSLGVDSKSDEYKNVYFATLLHDIGYLSSKLRMDMETADVLERAKIEQTHVIIGFEMTQKINLLKPIAKYIKYHHENFDGSGYPEGLKGEEIPLVSRIVSVCEFIEDSRASGLSEKEVIQQLEAQSGKKFDPKIVQIVKDIIISSTT